MAPLLLPLFYFLTLLVPINVSLINMSLKTKKLAELDKQLGDKSEELCTSINSALALNAALRTMHATCEAAIYSGTFPAMEAAAQIIRVEQELLIFEAQFSIQTLSPLKFSKNMNVPERGAMGNCGLPDVLQCRDKNIFNISHDDGLNPAGVKAEASGMGMNCSEVRWEYSDDRVKVLP